MEQDLKQGVELTNQKQEGALSKLRASIQAQRELRIKVDESLNSLGRVSLKVSVPKLELVDVPELTIESGAEFNLDRYYELCNRAEKLYHNYLATSAIEEIKLLAVEIDDLVSEAIKPTFS